MPIYAFDCNKCDSSFEKLVRSAAAVDEVVCPKCGSTHVQRRLSTFAAHVQGGTRVNTSAPSSSCSTGGT